MFSFRRVRCSPVSSQRLPWHRAWHSPGEVESAAAFARQLLATQSTKSAHIIGLSCKSPYMIPPENCLETDISSVESGRSVRTLLLARCVPLESMRERLRALHQIH